MSIVYGNAVGNTAPIKTLILTDENGVEFAGVVTGSEVIFTATDNDVRAGSIYAGNSGVSTGTKDIPSYHTSEGVKIITSGKPFIIKINDYDYTKLQAIICEYNKTLADSVSAQKVAILGNVYDVQSTDALSTVIKDDVNGQIDFGITNTSDAPCLVRYFAYKEIY